MKDQKKMSQLVQRSPRAPDPVRFLLVQSIPRAPDQVKFLLVQSSPRAPDPVRFLLVQSSPRAPITCVPALMVFSLTPTLLSATSSTNVLTVWLRSTPAPQDSGSTRTAVSATGPRPWTGRSA